ncbi:hypothetical protein LEP48_01320 [Isoptericola sp. NEAU-Y5]|uniref:Uncharacterized protein n=1 Tax=Isoptericola luteus TaxID=2879484 RepID=A0ABS7ZAC9_9MICO|nr:hypothetical protein [Isoptericola sp. NEAU-Y5]MCA5891990.1 hypothetical protein [Isoptericola sp. NEAU-Y5]
MRLAVAEVLAAAADGHTGRGVALAVETIAERAEVSERSVRNVRAWLAVEGLAVEAVRGRHLTRAERQARRALGRGGIVTASVWALTHEPIGAAHPDLVEVSGISRKSQLPQARRAGTKRKRQTTARDTAPRSLALQRLTAEVARRSPGLAPEGRHLGGLADVLARAFGEAVETARVADVFRIAEAGGAGRVWALEGVRDVWGWLGARIRAGRSRGFATAAERATRDAEARTERERRRAAERVAERAARATTHSPAARIARDSIRAAIAAARQGSKYAAPVGA